MHFSVRSFGCALFYAQKRKGELQNMEELDFKEIGKRIERQREIMKYTNRELSEKSGISIARLRNLERGNAVIQLKESVTICNALEMNLNYLLTGYIGAKEASDLLHKTERLSPYNFNNVMKFVNCLDEYNTTKKPAR